MSCQLCIKYRGLYSDCFSGYYVHDAYISIDCDDYKYNPKAIGEDLDERVNIKRK